MKFGEAYRRYLQEEREQDQSLAKCSHVEYKRLKKLLKSCRRRSATNFVGVDSENRQICWSSSSQHRHAPCQHSQSCSVCDGMFFCELENQASEINRYLTTRVRSLVDNGFCTQLGKNIRKFQFCCFKNDMQDIVQRGIFLFEYIAMNATAMRKILKKYDKVHGSVNGNKFKSILQSHHLEPLQSPWLMELCAFYLNSGWADNVKSSRQIDKFYCGLGETRSVMELSLSSSLKLEYNLNCSICLETMFNPYALGCGHVFCKTCLCSSSSVLLFQGVKSASPESKCPICRESGVYANARRMVALDLLVKKRCEKYWKERLQIERAEGVKQAKKYWDQQTIYFTYDF